MIKQDYFNNFLMAVCGTNNLEKARKALELSLNKQKKLDFVQKNNETILADMICKNYSKARKKSILL